MNRPTRLDYWHEVVDGVVLDYRRLEAACNAAIQAGAMDPNGPLHEAIWKSFDCMLDRIDRHQWIHWFVYDNDCGRRALQAKGCRTSEFVVVKTSRRLASLIVQAEERS